MFIDEIIPGLVHAAYRHFLVGFLGRPLHAALRRLLDDATELGVEVHPSHYAYVVHQAEGKYQ
jgi:hypothetical protein